MQVRNVAEAIAIAGTLLSGAAVLAQGSPQGGTSAPAPQRVYYAAPPTWVEGYPTPIRVASNERLAVLGSPHSFRLIDLTTGRLAEGSIWSGLDSVYFAAFGARGDLLLSGSHAGAVGWFEHGARGAVRLPLPPDANPEWSPDGRLVAYTRSDAPDSGLFVGPVGKARAHPTRGGVASFAWFPDGRSLLVLSTDSATALSSMSRLEAETGRTEILVRELDAVPFSSAVAVASDGRAAYIALASASHPKPEARHDPTAPRALHIYAVDFATGTRRVVAAAPGPGDSFAPTVAGDHLYWVRAAIDASLVVVPIGGGPVRQVLSDAGNPEVPAWRPDGRQIGFTYGQFRLADWGIDLDGGVVDVDGAGHATGDLQPFIVGYNEDMGPAWSPAGRWIAYHSHHAETAIPYMGAPGGTIDDMWIKRVGAPPRDTAAIRLTHFGLESGFPSWSRDGTRIAFISMERGGEFGVSHPYFVRIDPETGRVLETGRLPVPPDLASVMWVGWSPVSDDLALEHVAGGGRHALWILPAGGAAPRKLVEYPMQTYGLASWTPDGKALVYSALTGGRMQLYWISANGGAPHQLTHDTESLLHPAVSPNGELIAASRITRLQDIWRIPVPRDGPTASR
jgi:Tol biopolymer transport system component